MRKSVLSSVNIRSLIDKFDTIDYWCDYLSFSYYYPVAFLDKILFWIDNDNSNFACYSYQEKDFTYVKTVVTNWLALTFTYSYNWISYPLFQYVKFNNSTRAMVKKWWKINFYWSYFRLVEIWEFDSMFIYWLLKSFSNEDPNITRYDFRIDYFSTENDVEIPEINTICEYVSPQSTVRNWFIGNKLIDWSVWNSDTWRYVIRYYDKKIDTDKKNKRALYTDFVKYRSVHRLEFEFLSAFTKWFTLKTLANLEWKILCLLNLDQRDKSSRFEWKLFYSYDSSCEITPENAWKFIDRYINLSKKLLKAWYSPYQLIEEAIIWTYWNDVALWLLEDFLNKSLVNRWLTINKNC